MALWKRSRQSRPTYGPLSETLDLVVLPRQEQWRNDIVVYT